MAVHVAVADLHVVQGGVALKALKSKNPTRHLLLSLARKPLREEPQKLNKAERRENLGVLHMEFMAVRAVAEEICAVQDRRTVPSTLPRLCCSPAPHRPAPWPLRRCTPKIRSRRSHDRHQRTTEQLFPRRWSLKTSRGARRSRLSSR